MQALIYGMRPIENQAMVDKEKSGNAELAKRIASAIAESNLPKKKIAEALGVTPQAVGSWEKTGRIGKETLRDFAHIMGKNLSDFIPGMTLPANDADHGQTIVLSEAVELLTLFKQASPKGRTAILKAARSAVQRFGISDTIGSTEGESKVV